MYKSCRTYVSQLTGTCSISIVHEYDTFHSRNHIPYSNIICLVNATDCDGLIITACNLKIDERQMYATYSGHLKLVIFLIKIKCTPLTCVSFMSKYPFDL